MKDNQIVIKIKKLREDAIIPTYVHYEDSCVDLYSVEDKEILWSNVILIHTGIAVEIPFGYEGLIRSRRGDVLNNHYVVCNSPGIIDSNYRNEINIVLYNTSPVKLVHIKKGDRIAQLVIQKVPKKIIFEEVDELGEN